MRCSEHGMLLLLLLLQLGDVASIAFKRLSTFGK
jgi:hypothetical protein